jgi:HSP20 family protein
MSNNTNLITLMDQFFDDAFLPATRRVSSSFFGSLPALNIKEFKDRFEITITAPSIDINKAKIELHERVLSIKYENEIKDLEEGVEEGILLRQEYLENVNFSRSVTLPKNVDEDSVKASYKQGILKVLVNKLPENQPKNIIIENQD